MNINNHNYALERMKCWRVVGIVAMLVMVSAVGLYVQMTVGDRSHSGNWGDFAGRGFDTYSMPLDPANGSYARFEVSSIDGRAVDVYLTDADGLSAARAGEAFEYDAELSAVNTTHIVKDLRISEYRHVVVMSYYEDEVVKVTSSTDQSSYPLDLMPVLQATWLICLIADLFLAVLLIQAWKGYARERRAGKS